MHPLSSDLLRLAVAVVRFLPGALDEFASRAGSAPLDRAGREVLLQSRKLALRGLLRARQLRQLPHLPARAT